MKLFRMTISNLSSTPVICTSFYSAYLLSRTHTINFKKQHPELHPLLKYLQDVCQKQLNQLVGERKKIKELFQNLSSRCCQPLIAWKKEVTLIKIWSIKVMQKSACIEWKEYSLCVYFILPKQMGKWHSFGSDTMQWVTKFFKNSVSSFSVLTTNAQSDNDLFLHEA